ncbi:MAG: DUF7901 domain-containing protein, partial [Planctomycetota bacterium]
MQQFTGVGAAAVLADLGYLEVNNYNLWILDAPQLNCTVDIETNDTRLLNAVLRNGKIWTTGEAGTGGPWPYPPTSSSRAEVAWYEFSPAAVGPFPGGTPIQQGRVSGMGDPPLHYYFPSVAVNSKECVALGFSGSNEQTYASAFYTMREPTDPLGMMQPVALLKAGEAPYWKQYGGSRNRWGDFSATMVDPTDDSTFWTVQEYASNGTVPVPCDPNSGVWGTWWGSFQCGACEKWVQPPDETEKGMDIRCDRNDGMLRTLADDFYCTTTGPITCVTLWGSWNDDGKGNIQTIHLSIHDDDPCGPGGSDPDNDYSKPDELLWSRDFHPGDFNETLYATGIWEWWWDPATFATPIWPGDQQIWQYEITIDDSNQFIQQGDACDPNIYWLDVWVKSDTGEFGWKTSWKHWNDDAVWSNDDGLSWNELRYPPGHPDYPNSIDLAFKICSCEEPNEKQPVPHLKWSQPPIEIDPTLDTPVYCGWDVESFTDDPWSWWNIVADDFRCLGTMPVTSVHWWGSYIDWDEVNPPGPNLPIAWRIGFWSNVPAGIGADYSYPEVLLWQIELDANRVDEQWVGMDLAPWPEPSPESCFQYYVDLEPEEYFWQGDFIHDTNDNVFWISIAAMYENTPFN